MNFSKNHSRNLQKKQNVLICELAQLVEVNGKVTGMLALCVRGSGTCVLFGLTGQARSHYLRWQKIADRLPCDTFGSVCRHGSQHESTFSQVQRSLLHVAVDDHAGDMAKMRTSILAIGVWNGIVFSLKHFLNRSILSPLQLYVFSRVVVEDYPFFL